MLCSGQQNFLKNCVETAAWIGRIMAEIEPYCFEPMRDSSESGDKTMFTREPDERKGEMRRRVYVSVLQTGKGSKRKNGHAARRSRKPYIKFQVNNTFVVNRC